MDVRYAIVGVCVDGVVYCFYVLGTNQVEALEQSSCLAHHAENFHVAQVPFTIVAGY